MGRNRTLYSKEIMPCLLNKLVGFNDMRTIYFKSSPSRRSMLEKLLLNRPLQLGENLRLCGEQLLSVIE